jgi:hypothetical protein
MSRREGDEASSSGRLVDWVGGGDADMVCYLIKESYPCFTFLFPALGVLCVQLVGGYGELLSIIRLFWLPYLHHKSFRKENGLV